MNKLPTQGELLLETYTQKQDKSRCVDTRLETTYVST